MEPFTDPVALGPPGPGLGMVDSVPPLFVMDVHERKHTACHVETPRTTKLADIGENEFEIRETDQLRPGCGNRLGGNVESRESPTAVPELDEKQSLHREAQVCMKISWAYRKNWNRRTLPNM